MQRPRAELLAGRTISNSSQAAVRQWLVVAQIAVSMVLLAGGALLFRSFWNLQNQQLGMHTQSVVTARVSLGRTAYPTPEKEMAFFQTLQRGLRYGPGISALAISDSLPPGGFHRDQIYASIAVDGRPRPAGETGGLVAWRWITPEYFRALEIPIVQGEGFTEEELTSTNRFVVLSRKLADRIFPGQNPIGRRLRLAGGAADDPSYTVVAVADDVKNGGLAGGDEPEYYRLRRTQPEDWTSDSAIIVKSALQAQFGREMDTITSGCVGPNRSG